MATPSGSADASLAVGLRADLGEVGASNNNRAAPDPSTRLPSRSRPGGA
jgi:hypothetical protein